MTDTPTSTDMPFTEGGYVEIDNASGSLRTDIWVKAFDGIYRLFLDLPQALELERKCGFIDKDGNRRSCGLLAIYGRVAKGRYELEGRPVGFAVEGEATILECRETVLQALIGGGHAVVNGERVRTDASRASQIVNTYLLPSPIEDSWNLAYLALHTAVVGRQQRENEIGTRSTKAIFPEIDAAEAGDG